MGSQEYQHDHVLNIYYRTRKIVILFIENQKDIREAKTQEVEVENKLNGLNLFENVREG